MQMWSSVLLMSSLSRAAQARRILCVRKEEVYLPMKEYSILCKVLQTILVMMVPVGLIFFYCPFRGPLSWVICVVLLAVGIRIFVLSRREFDGSGQKLTPKAFGTSTLMTSGIYSSIRHPHNLASMLLNLAIAFGLRSTVGLVIAVASIPIGYWFTLEEEKLLMQQFGDRYREYKAGVPMFVPKLRKRAQ